jgi:hypothetical protein
MSYQRAINLIRTEELRRYRDAEYAAAVKEAPNALAAYWAGSATASIARDVAAGRVVTINAK